MVPQPGFRRVEPPSHANVVAAYCSRLAVRLKPRLMISHPGNTPQRPIDSSAPAATTAEVRLPPEQNTSYQQALRVARTTQEQTFVTVMQREHERLGRAPTLYEIKTALADTALGTLSKDRLSQINSSLTKRLPEGVNPIAFTRDNPLFRHLDQARTVYEKFVAQHNQPPTLQQLKKLLEKSKIEVTESSLKNILKHLRETASTNDAGFCVSRYRIPITTSQIKKAHDQAAKYLREVGISKAPSAALVVNFLSQAGHSIKRDTLENRFKTRPELKSLQLSPHFDPGIAIITSCHKRLRSELGRDPTAKELTSAYNKLSLQKANPDSIWTRVSRINKTLPREQRMSFAVTFGSGIYDADFERIAKAATTRIGRPPTLKELTQELVSNVAGSYITADCVHRRCRRLGVVLTSERCLTQDDQLLIAHKIKELSTLFGRRPFGAEVRTALENGGISVSQKEFNTTLASAKRHRDEDFRTAVRLGLPGHLSGKLRKEYDAWRRTTDGYPDATQLAQRLGWTVAGVESAMPAAQARAVRFREPPVLLANTPQGEAFGALRTLVQNLFATLARDAAATPTVSPKQRSTLASMIVGWNLPPLPIDDVAPALTFDQKLVRYEQWWVLITCLQTPPLQIEEQCGVDARLFEARLTRDLGVKDRAASPFEGFVQTLRVAHEAGRLSKADLIDVLTQVKSSSSISSAYQILRNKLLRLAQQCGFPNPTNVRQKPPGARKRRLADR